MSLIIPDDIDKEFRKGKSENTYKTYVAMMSKLFRECFDTKHFSVDALKDTKKVEKCLKPMSTTSEKIITIALVMTLKAANAPKSLIDAYGKMARASRIKDSKERVGRKVTLAESEAFLPWKAILAIRDEYESMIKDKSYMQDLTKLEYARDYMRYVTICLFTMIPPQRGEVYFNMYIDRPDEDNNIDTKKGVMTIKEHKTKRSYGERQIRLPPKLNNLIKEWKEVSNCSSGLLLCNSQGKRMTTQSFTQFVNDIFERKISTDMLRKIYITHMIEDMKISEAEKADLAQLMGHSQKVQKDYYLKNF